MSYSFFRRGFGWPLAMLILIICLTGLPACKKDSFTTSPNASVFINEDTLKFDTVFATVGSITQSFKIFNNNDQKILFSSIQLAGGNNSSFRINVNGIAGAAVNNITLEANDSLYIFVTASINPTLANLPFLVNDSIQVNYNGNRQQIQLQAYGQNAHFLNNQTIRSNTTWPNDLPYVILGSLRIDTNATLTIQKGCRIYCHNNTPILVDGSLQANGTVDEPILFTGDRLDAGYNSLPGSWAGIYCRGASHNNQFTFTSIQNAYQALVVEQPSNNAQPKATLNQCIINNASNAGIRCVNTSLVANNTLVSNCAANPFTYGGVYTLTHCTLVGIANPLVLHKNPSLYINNVATIGGATLTADINFTLRNCIVWGEGGIFDNEIVAEKMGTNLFNLNIDHCLYKAIADPAFATITDAIKNDPPLFDSVNTDKNTYNFHISNPLAPGINKGVITNVFIDLDNQPRNVGLPDIGCYEQR